MHQTPCGMNNGHPISREERESFISPTQRSYEIPDAAIHDPGEDHIAKQDVTKFCGSYLTPKLLQEIERSES